MMKLSGSFLSTPLILVLYILFVHSSAFGADPNRAPELTLPGDTSVRLCVAESICYDIVAADPDHNDSITLTLLEGPIAYDPQTFGPNFTENICFYPSTTGLYPFVWQIEDILGNVAIDTVVFSVSVNILPVIEDQFFSEQVCFSPHPRLLPIRAYDPDCDTLRYFIVEGLGTIEKYTGILEYEADTSGVYSWLIEVLDDCVADTARVYDTVYINQPPLFYGEDLTVSLVDAEEICFDLSAVDPEGGPVMIFHNEGPGTTTQTSDTSAQTCFMPINVDSATYMFVYCMVDECPYNPSETSLSNPSCAKDTVYYTVLIDQAPQIDCPDSLSYFICRPETFCFEISAIDPENGPISYHILSGNAAVNGTTVCFEASEAGQFVVMIEAVDSVGHADTCSVPITIETNQNPYITMADDFSMTLCVPQAICFAAVADDPEFDIASVEVNYGYFDDATDRICFETDTSGVYQLIMTATDGCGVAVSDTTNVTIKINEDPIVTLADDFSISVCEGESICFDASFADDNPGLLIVSPGFEFDSAMSQICFTPDSSGVYEAWLRLTDDCDIVVVDTIRITVDFKQAPELTVAMPDSSIYLCNPTSICLPLQFSDFDGDITSITASHGQYDTEAGTLCFVPYGGGEYQIIVTATDGCGQMIADTAVVTVLTDEAVQIIVPADTSLFLCEADTLCFPVSGIPAGASVEVSGTGAFWDEATQSVCFYSDCCIENLITVSATTMCGTYSASFMVTIETNSKPLVIVPADSSFFFCEPTEIRLPLGASDIDGNLMNVVVDGAEYDAYRGEMYFTPDTTGVYIITVTATDSCGATDVDQINLGVVVNTAPWITFDLPDSLFRQCELGLIAIPIDYFDAETRSVLWVTTNVGEVKGAPDSVISELWITPEQFGEICVELIATDNCGAVDTANFCITVEQGDFVSLSCPIVELAELCDTATLFVPFETTGNAYTVTTSYGEIVEGGLSFFADTSGNYIIDIIATSECNADTCQLVYPIVIAKPIEIVCSGDTSVFLCDSTIIPFDFTINGAYDNLTLLGPAYFGSFNSIYVKVETEGDHLVTLIASSNCFVDTCSFTVSADFNEVPTISANDTSVIFCEIQPVCLPVVYGDADGNIETVTASMGELVDGTLCFTPPDFGNYEIIMGVRDSCYVTVYDTVNVSVIKGEFVAITCPTVDQVELCGPGQVCFPIDAVGTNFQLSTDLGTITDGQLCFDADTSGTYIITIIGDAGCNSDTCIVSVPVTVTEPVTLSCQANDSTVFFCETPGHMMFPVEFSGDDVQLTVLPAEAWYENGFVHINVDTAGLYEFEIIAENQCNADTCNFSATAIFNSPPELTASFDTTIVACDLQEICLPLSVTDIDNNIVEIRSTLGVVNDTIVCFTPEAYGDYEIIVTAIDDCQTTVVDTINLSIVEGSRAAIECPISSILMNIPTPAEARIPLGIMPVDAQVTVLPFGEYDVATGEIVAFFDTTGVYTFTVIAEAFCNFDTCTFEVEVDQYFSPKLACTGSVDTAICITEPTTVCLPFTVTGTNVQVAVKPVGTIVGNTVCIEVDGPGEYNVELIAFNEIEADTCATILVVLPGEPAQVTLPADFPVSLCAPETICLPVDIQKTDFGLAAIDAGFAQYDSETGEVCFLADTAGTYEVIVVVVDSCGYLAADTTFVTVGINLPPTVVLVDDFDLLLCGPQEVCVDLTVDDINLASVNSNLGQYNSETGQVCFMTEGSGVYTLIVEATDDCGATVSDTINVTVEQNSAPTIEPLADTTVYFCTPTSICLPVLLTDIDGNITEITTSHGQYDPQTGTLCFVPYDGGEYEIIISATDSCGLTVTDTATVTVLTDQAIQIVVPNDTSLFLCEADTICFPVSGIPADAVVEVSGTGTYWNEATQSVCFYSDCCIENLITVSATTECGTYSASFMVTIETNSKPLVIVPQDTVFHFCESTEIRFPLGASDINGNLMNVVVEGATYDSYRGEIFFTPDTTGDYTITVTATDSCGATDVDQINLSVVVNTAPWISYEIFNSAFRQCELSEISIPINLGDAEGNELVPISSFGTIVTDSLGEYWLVFTPTGFGINCIDLKVADECSLQDSIQVCITVEQGDFVSLSCPIVEPAELCDTATLFIPFDITGNAYTVTTSYGEIVEGGLNFFADTSGNYIIDIIAASECSADTCQLDIYVDIAEPPVVTLDFEWNADTLLLCEPTALFAYFTLSEAVDSFTVIGAPGTWGTPIEGFLELAVDYAGTFDVSMIGYGRCGVDTASISFTIEMNQAPTITANDSSVIFCEILPICIPVEYDDPNGNIVSVSASRGEIVDGTLCFTAPDFDDYEIILTVSDSCGLTAVDTINVSVLKGEFVEITCPTVDPVELCGSGQVCLPIDAVGVNYQLLTDLGTIVEGELCFDADTSGTYVVTIIGDAGCNSDTCVVSVDVTVTEPVTISCQTNDSTVFFCDAPNHMMFPVEFSGDSVQLSVLPSEAWYENGFVHINVDTAGFYEFEIIAENQCNADTCSFNATAIFNSPPELNASFDTTIVACDLQEICLPLAVTDIDNNLVEIRSTLGVVNDTIVCFTPEAYGDYEIIVTAIDDCQATVVDTINLSIIEGSRAAIECPISPIQMNIPTPAEARIPLGIMPVEATVTVLPFGSYDANTGEIVAFFDTTGVWTFTVIADAYCDSDTCSFVVEIGQYFPPELTCAGSVDSAICITEPTTVCLPFTVSGTNVQVVVEPFGTIVGNTVCIEVDGPGEYNVELIAYNEIEADTCATILVVLPGEPAQVTLPADFPVSLCAPETICLPIDIQKTDFGIAVIDAGFAQFNPETNDVCFMADTAGTYEVILVAVDSCGYLAADTTFVTVGINVAPTITLGDDFDLLQCGPQEICVDLTVADINLATVTSNLGQYDPETGQVCFMTEGSSVYTLIVEATDDCGATASDTINITVEENSPPTIEPLADTTVYLCAPAYICLEALLDDIDGNIVSVTTNRGQYTDGQICFVPYSMGTFEVILTVTDSCGLTAVDTALVTVETDQAVQVIVPNDTSFFLCEPDTVCFPVSGIPAGASVEVAGTGTWWDEATQSVCFYSDCCLENLITVIATTECGSYSSSFTVTIETNSKPMVIVPTDSTLLQCEPAPICFPVAVSDPDGNLMSVTVDGADYDDYRDQACFTPNGSGTYTITITATDSCGAVDADQITFFVTANQAPTVLFDVPQTLYQQCTLEEICLKVYTDDVDGNLAEVVTNYGTLFAESDQVCFLPDTFGVYCIDVTAVDSCGVSTTERICITVAEGDYVAIDCPTVPIKADTLCAPKEICIFLDIAGDNFDVSTDYGTWADGRLCFDADTSGTYTITVIASAECVTDTCVIIYPVKILDPVRISCPGDQTEFLCGRDTLRYEFTASESVTSITVSSPAYIEGNEVVIPILLEGTLPITMIANGRCEKDTCSFSVTTNFNDSPAIAAIRDTALVECSLLEVCLPISVSDPDGNIASVTTTHGTVSEANDKICFTPPDYGVYDITIIVTDECGKSASQIFSVSYTEGKYASILCPDDNQFVSLCGPDTVCIIAPITPLDAKVTVLPNGVYKSATGEICVWVTEGGSMPITIIAESQCYTDTCEFILEVEMGTAPVVSAPTEIDTILCLAEPTTLCFEVDVSGTGVQVNVNPVGTFSAGTICVPIEEAGSIELEIIAYGTCGADTTTTTLNVSADQLPELFLPENMTVERCPDDTNSICLDGIFGTDAESEITLNKLCGPGTFDLAQPDSGGICWLPEAFGLSEFCFEITDGCHTVGGSFTIDVVTKSDCEVCVRAIIDGGASIPVGLRKTVAINVETNDAIGGFDLLLSYDASALTFVGATTDGTAIDEWEYFTYNLGNAGCGVACPSGVVRLVGIADINNGANHPPDWVYNPEGVLAYAQFQVANDQNLESQFIPINFVWYDCGDNTFSDASGTLLYMDLRIFDLERTLIWDEEDNDLFPDNSRPFGMGAPDECLAGTEKGQPLRCIEFINGGINITPAGEMKDRGDINLDGLAYTIADAVIFTNYFIEGLVVFTRSISRQIAATDINADGITLSVADLVYLIRVVVGDADPIPKLIPYAENMIITGSASDGLLTISTSAVATIGAGHIIYQIPPDVAISDVRLTDQSRQMDLDYSIEGDQLKLILYNIGQNSIPAGDNKIIEIEYTGNGQPEAIHLEFADYQGRPYNELYKELDLPIEYSLDQNYPNPFNPTTNISFYLVEAGVWELQIFNVRGELVRRFNGHAAAGQIDLLFDGRSSSGQQIASGVYLYRLRAGQFTETKKMILLK